MITDSTIKKLRELHLLKMAEVYQDIILNEEYDELSFDEKFSRMVNAEWVNKIDNRVQRLKKAAKFQIPEACPEGIRYFPERHLNQFQIEKLMSCGYIRDSLNIIIFGPTGAGKSYLSCAFGFSAVRNFFTVRYIRLPELCMEFENARMEGNLRKTLNTYKKVNLLIIDEWLSFPIKQEDTQCLLDIFEARYDHASTILCTQIEIEGWYEKIGNPVYTDSICDRVVHNAYKIKMEGESMRKIRSQEKLEDAEQ